MLQAIGLTSTHRRAGPPAVDDLSFDAPPGRVTVLLGPAGSGKTTALRLILGIESGRGITRFRGNLLDRVANPAREVGALLGDVPGHPARTARGQLRMLCAAAGVPSARADEALAAVGLTALGSHRLGTLPLGADRRLGLAAALLADPRTLVLDEPLTGLSPGERGWWYAALRDQAARSRAVLCTGEDPKEAVRLADRVVTIDSGRLVADQDAGDFARTRLRPRVAVSTPHAARLAALLQREARAAHRSVEAVAEHGSLLSVYGSSCAEVGETAFRHGVLVHRLAEESGDGAAARPGAFAAGRPPERGEAGRGRAVRQSEGPSVSRPVPVTPIASPAAGPGSLPSPVPDPDPAPDSASRPNADSDPPSGPNPEPVSSASPVPGPAAPGTEPQTLPDSNPHPHPEPGGAGGRASSAVAPAPPPAPSRTAALAGVSGLRRPTAPESPANPESPITPKRSTASGATPSRRAAAPRPRPGRAAGPVRPVRYELHRLFGVRTPAVVLAVTALASVVICLLMARSRATPVPVALAAWPEYLPLPPAALGAGLIGALSFGDEYRYPALAAARGAVPRRLGLLLAKLVVTAAVVVPAALAVVAADALALHLVYGTGADALPRNPASPLAGWCALTAGCAWAGLLAAGVFRVTSAGVAAVLAVPVVVAPLLQQALVVPSARSIAGFPGRLREIGWVWLPRAADGAPAAVLRLSAQPVGLALMLSLTVLICVYLFTGLRRETPW
ncbi:ATP-binding cassette domain-containing protein [Streptomyces sp. CAU 1734]|uniref:ATP-binding cassette domain-containing protein n=1 Tax=Streptomyces sp. CAU 1734 TaxID=3140360 RepID=UPI00326134D9